MSRFTLEKFEKNDVFELISEIDSPELMITWGGAGFEYPLAPEQFNPLLEAAELPEPKILLFKFSDIQKNKTAGHIELLRIDYLLKTLWLGRVLIYKDYRARGLGSLLISTVLEKIFGEMKFENVKLNVFDYNLPAIKCYEKAGFRKEEYFKEGKTINGKTYSHYCMSITREEYLSLS